MEYFNKPLAKGIETMDNFSRCTGVETTNSANSIAEHKTPDAGILQVPKRDWLYATSSAKLAAIESRLGSQTWKGAHTGRFSCSRCYERDSTAPLRPAIDRGGIEADESAINVRAVTQPPGNRINRLAPVIRGMRKSSATSKHRLDVI